MYSLAPILSLIINVIGGVDVGPISSTKCLQLPLPLKRTTINWQHDVWSNLACHARPTDALLQLPTIFQASKLDYYFFLQRRMRLTVHTNPLGCFQNKKAVLSQRWPRNAPYIWVPWKFSAISGLPDYAHGHCSQHFHGLLFRSTLWMFLQNLKSVALPVPEIIGVPHKFGQSLDTPTLHFLQNF